MDDLFPETVDRTINGTTWRVGAYSLRNVNGWLQSREDGQREWLFYVSGFSGPEGGNGLAHVLRCDGTTRAVSIDSKDRIEIDGRRYGRRFWNH